MKTERIVLLGPPKGARRDEPIRRFRLARVMTEAQRLRDASPHGHLKLQHD